MSDSDSDYSAEWEQSRYSDCDTLIRPTDECFERWGHISIPIKKESAQQMQLCVFWLPILLQREDSTPIHNWGVEIGIIDRENTDMTLKHLHRIEILEAVFRALERGSLRRELTRQIFVISNMFNLGTPRVLEEALHWLERTGEPHICSRIMEFGTPEACFKALRLIFTEFAKYIQKMSNHFDRTRNELRAQTSDYLKRKSEEMKEKGNEKFQKKQYGDAVKFYSQAIQFYPDNHIIYGNRALCYIRSKMYLKAVGDGKRATLIKPPWQKGHYRFCEALFFLGKVEMAINANIFAQTLCKDEREGIKDLEQQYHKFISETRPQQVAPPKNNKRAASTNRADAVESRQQPVKQSFKIGVVRDKPPQSKVPEVKMDKPPGKNERSAPKESAKDTKPAKSVLPSKSEKAAEPSTTAKKKSKNRKNQREVLNQKWADSKAGMSKELRSVVEDAYTTLADLRSRDAEQAFSQAPAIVETNTTKNQKLADSKAGMSKELRSVVEDAYTVLADLRSRDAEQAFSQAPAIVETNTPKNQKVADSKAGMSKELRSMVQDAYTALADLRSRNAEQAFSQALAIVETNTPKEFGLSTLDVLLLLYGRAAALTHIGQPEELSEAQKLLEKIKTFEERTFQCLVYYAIGRMYLKENRFAVALQQFSDSLLMVKNQITPGKLTWPLTKEIVKETQTEYFKEVLEDAIELCRFPPCPDAMCRLEKSQGHLKAEIYFTDPDFKGFIQLCCCQSCTIEYHITCWKTLKTTAFFEKNEKDLLQEACLTPDCVGQICSITIIDPTGLVKCKFEAAVQKTQSLKRPKVNQKCTSLKKLQSKEERKLRRKQHKQSFQDHQVINNEILQQKDDSATQSQQKAWLLYRDRVLLQISQHMELLREEKGLHVSTLTGSLKPWLELDSSRGSQLAERMLNWQREPPETLGPAVELLLERKNRVWARVLIELLSDCLNVNPKLNSWACKLNDAGLNAAKSFIDRHAGHLEELDLALLLNFGPLQEMIITKLGTRPELFSSIGLTVTEYLKQAQPHDMRLFIWTLEEHRDQYVSCHSILDEYFDMMDGHFSVLKKSDENQNNSPMRAKNRGRKKKQKEPKGVIVFSGMRGVTSRDEWDQDFFEDDSLSFLDAVDPFSVPSHLREQVADFEDQFNSTRHRSHYKKILDNHPDPTKESLYDYFAQILEEHGPLVAEDPLLVGELENFPAEAQRKIEEAGGFESFLLESLRFIKMGRCIGLARHAVDLQQAGHGASLDDLDVIADSDPNSPYPDLSYPDLHESTFTDSVDNFSSPRAEVYPVLPSPYVYGFPGFSEVEVSGLSLVDPYSQWSSGSSDPYFLPNNYGEIDIHVNESYFGVSEMDPSPGGVASLTAEENTKKHAAAQTCPAIISSVAVNTELHQRFESCQGDLNKKEKSNRMLEQQIQEMVNGCDKVKLKHKEDTASLDEDIQKITASVQVTNKELLLFQQKLEEEVKRDQKEKKANQEALKSLKLEIEQLVEEQGSLTQNIREKKANFDAKFTDFLELGNQSEAEKMSLDDEIKRCKTLITSADRRSHNAHLSVVESSRDQGLYGLYRELADAKALLTKLDEAVHRYPNQDLEMTRNSWRANVQEAEKKISIAEAQYQEQIDQVRRGRGVSELPPVNINNQPQPPVSQLSATAKDFTPQASATLMQLPAAEFVAALPFIPPTRARDPQHNTVFEKAMERLGAMFPDYTRSDLMKFVQELRSSSGGTLSSMALQDVVGGVTQLILDHQEKLISVRSNIVGRGSPAHCATPPLINPAPVWQSVASQRATHSNAINMEDPCIICHEDMSPDDMCVLECRHSFHKECIRSWLKEQSTCPTCRDHALLPEDFPVLPGRRRQAP